MSKVQMLRSLVNQRLTAAAEEIFGLFERTIAEYEEELSRSKEENERQQKLLDAVLNPRLQLHRADVQQLLVVKGEDPPEQQEWSSSVDQEDPEPPHIKEEQEELWISQEGEQLHGQEEADITKFTFTPVPVKSEDEEEKPQSSQLHQGQTEQMETEADGEDCGGPEASRNSDPDRHLQPETDDSDDDWKETREPQSGSNSLRNDEFPVGDSRCSGIEKPFRCSECGKRFCQSVSLKRHMRSHTGDKPFSCSVCKKSFIQSGHLHTHMRSHTGERPFSCSLCKKTFTQSGHLLTHMRHHTGEKPYSCSVCQKSFTYSGHLQIHMLIHTGEKPFSCSVCQKSFRYSGQLQTHMISHTGKKPFSCSICKKSFTQSSTVHTHMRTHTGEKPFSCSVCAKRFSRKQTLVVHMRTHTGEQPFSCSVCGQRFTWSQKLKHHQCVGCQSSQLHLTQTEENREAEPPASSSAEQIKTEVDGEDCGGPEPVRNSDPYRHFTLETDDKTGESSEPET